MGIRTWEDPLTRVRPRSGSRVSGGARLRLSHRLFLLFLLAGAIPITVVGAVGWLQFRQQVRLWNVSSVESALEASLRSHRRAMDRLQRQLEDLGEEMSANAGFAEAAAGGDSAAIAGFLSNLAEQPGVDFAIYLERGPSGWTPLARSGSIETPELPTRLPDPEAGPLGPQRSRPLSLSSASGDLAAVPTYLWRGDGADSTLSVRGCLLLATHLGKGFFDDLGQASSGLELYRRLQDVSRVLRTADALLLALAFIVSVGIGFFLARRIARGISLPVESLVEGMEAVGRGDDTELRVRSRIPEMEALAGAFTRMRRTLQEYELQLREVEQVRGAQQTARFVAHEIRNALTPVRAGVSILARRVAELPDASRAQGERALEGIRAEAERMASLASAFSDYAHLPEPHPESLDVVEIIRSIAELEVPSEIECALDLHPLPRVWADRDEMERMLRNLIKNAVEAMDGAGSLRIEARPATDGEPIRIVIADRGPGMDDATLEKVFQPGFTTKPTGTGLGLPLVRSTVIRMGGRLSIESKPGEGTEVILRLPASEREGT